jgi:acyl-CoA synthetase (AMP-forming)/AMP-acid ligase II
VSNNILSLDEVIRPADAPIENGLWLASGRRSVQKLSYRELAKTACSGANILLKQGIRPGDVVAATITNDRTGVVTALAVWLAGATLVSLPRPPHKPSDAFFRSLNRILEASHATAIVGRRGFEHNATRNTKVIEPLSLVSNGDRPRDPKVPVAHPALIQFTSGSFGEPKGLCFNATTLTGHVHMIAETLALDPQYDRGLCWLPLSHDMGFVGFFLTALASRVDQVLLTPNSFLLSPSSWLRSCEAFKATITGGPNFALRMASRVSLDLPTGSLGSIRALLCGSERVDFRTLVEFADKTAGAGLRWNALLPVYGLAEATLAVCFPPLDRGPILGPGGHVSVGTPLAGVELSCPGSFEDPRELMIRGDWMFDGYLEARGQRKHDSPWFSTRDLGFCYQEEMYIVGRRDCSITIAGKTIVAEDIEALVSDHPGIGFCAAVPVPSGDRFALLVEMNQTLLDVRELLQELGAHVTATVGSRPFPIIPCAKWSIPRTTSGKPQRVHCSTMLDEYFVVHPDS